MVCSFLFQQRLDCVALPFIINTPEDKVVDAPSQDAVLMLSDQPPVLAMLALNPSLHLYIATRSLTPPPMLLKEDRFRALLLYHLPLPSAANRPIELIGKKPLILGTRTPPLMLRTSALLHGFDYIQLGLGYLGTAFRL